MLKGEIHKIIVTRLLVFGIVLGISLTILLALFGFDKVTKTKIHTAVSEISSYNRKMRELSGQMTTLQEMRDIINGKENYDWGFVDRMIADIKMLSKKYLLSNLSFAISEPQEYGTGSWHEVKKIISFRRGNIKIKFDVINDNIVYLFMSELSKNAVGGLFIEDIHMTKVGEIDDELIDRSLNAGAIPFFVHAEIGLDWRIMRVKDDV